NLILAKHSPYTPLNGQDPARRKSASSRVPAPMAGRRPMDPRKSYTSWGSRASRAYGPLSRALSCDVMSRSGCVDLDGEAGRIQQRSGGTAGGPLAQPKEEHLSRKILA